MRKARNIVHYKNAPHKMARSKRNQTKLSNNGGKQHIVWTLELKFDRNVSLTLDNIHEDTPLSSILQPTFLKKQKFTEDFHKWISGP